MVLGSGMLVVPCRAGWFHHWFHGDPTVRTVTSYPVGDNCYLAGATCQPATPAVLQSVVTGYSRQTAYRTRWTQVPLTVYRPITTTDPVTGCTVTCMRPCSTFQWQARRVAYQTCRPLVSTIAVNTAPVAVQPLPLDSSIVTPGLAVPPGTVQPYYEGPADQVPTLPSDSVPGTVVPGTVAPGMLQPQVVPPSAAPGSGTGPAPASEVPADRISPYATGGTTSNYGDSLDATVQRPPAGESDLAPGYLAPGYGLDEGTDHGEGPGDAPSDTSERLQDFRPELQDVPADSGVRLGPILPDEPRPGTRGAPVTAPEEGEEGPELRPIPDPDQPSERAEPGPLDKLAGRGAVRAERLRLAHDPRKRLVPIRWADRAARGSHVVSRDSVPSTSHPQRLDDTGWESLSGVARHSRP